MVVMSVVVEPTTAKNALPSGGERTGLVGACRVAE